METFLAELKRARDEKGITLAEISAATFISENMLAALEQGNFSVLPQAYMRAFLREYSAVVGLDPDVTLQRYEEALRSKEPPPPVQPEQAAKPTVVELPPTMPAGRSKEEVMTGRLSKFIAIVVGLIAVELLVWQFMKKGTPRSVEEIPFQSVVKENEAMLVPDSLKRSRAPQTPAVAMPPLSSDSLTLVGVATDSVWLNIVLDTLQTREFLLKRGGQLMVRAKRRFIVTVGNAGGIDFTLNNRKIGKLGKNLAVVRNVVLTAQTQPKDVPR